jgi:hypothetical protein
MTKIALDIQKLLTSCWSRKISDWQLKIISDWPQIVGSLHEHARVDKVTEDTIWLGVYDTCWMQELHLLSNIMIKKINNYLGASHIKQMRLKYVQKHQFRTPKVPELQAHEPNQDLSLPQTIALQAISDPELKAAMHNFLTRCNYENQTK